MIINYDINNKGGGASAEGCLRYDEAQDLTTEQQAQAKENLGIEDPEPQAAVLYTPQTLTTAQQKQARQNIGMRSTFSYTVRYVDDSTGERLAPDKSETGINYGAIVTEWAFSIDGYQVKRESITKTIMADTVFEFAYIAEGGENGCVRYDQQQSLTDAQKTQALSNIGAAPFIAEAEIITLLTKSQVEQLYEAFTAGRPTFVKAKVSQTDLAPVLLQVISAEHFIGVSRQTYYLQVYRGKENYTIILTGSTVTAGTNTFVVDAIDSNMYVRKKGSWVILPDIPQPENHQVLKSALSEPMGCSANTWATLAELNVPEDGAYQVSASARMLPADQSTAFKTTTVSIELGTDAAGYTEVMEMTLPRSGEYGTLSVPVNATAGQKLRLRAISDANFYAQASPSAGKASATFIAAVRVGAIYQAQ